MKKYKVWAHSGLAWLHDLGTFDTLDEAQDALQGEFDQQLAGLSQEDSVEEFHELFYANSRMDVTIYQCRYCGRDTDESCLCTKCEVKYEKQD